MGAAQEAAVQQADTKQKEVDTLQSAVDKLNARVSELQSEHEAAIKLAQEQHEAAMQAQAGDHKAANEKLLRQADAKQKEVNDLQKWTDELQSEVMTLGERVTDME